jgi:hypothetical protein
MCECTRNSEFNQGMGKVTPQYVLNTADWPDPFEAYSSLPVNDEVNPMRIRMGQINPEDSQKIDQNTWLLIGGLAALAFIFSRKSR